MEVLTSYPPQFADKLKIGSIGINQTHSTSVISIRDSIGNEFSIKEGEEKSLKIKVVNGKIFIEQL